jgi:hypothetical protein
VNAEWLGEALAAIIAELEPGATAAVIGVAAISADGEELQYSITVGQPGVYRAVIRRDPDAWAAIDSAYREMAVELSGVPL